MSVSATHNGKIVNRIDWVTSGNVLPPRFEELMNAHPEVRLFQSRVLSMVPYNKLQFIETIRGRHTTSVDTIGISASLHELEVWLAKHVNEFQARCSDKDPIRFELVGTSLARCECAVTWFRSMDLATSTIPPPNFVRVLEAFPEVRRFQYISMRPDTTNINTLTFTLGGKFGNLSANPTTKKSYDINASTSFEELEEWLLGNLQDFYSGCMLLTTNEIKKSFQSQIRNGDNPYCIVWRAPSMAKMPYILIYTFLKIPGVHIAFLKSTKMHHLEMRSPSGAMPATISDAADFQDQRTWIKTQLLKLSNQRVSTVVETLPDFRTDIMPKMARNEIAYCLVWYGPKNDPLPYGLVELKHIFPNVCVAHTIDDSHEIWMVNQSSSLLRRLPDSATLSDLREFIGSTSKFRSNS